ncbi:MAG: serine hydrolase domain-containing protein [Planctomycetota bacterium]
MPRPTLLALVLFLPLLLSAPLWATRLPEEREDLVRAIDDLAERERIEQKIPGLSVAVVRGEETLLAKGFGLADVELEVPATAATVYRIGSVTKQFTAAAILQLREDGKLELEDPITSYLTGLPERTQDVTIRHLLNHTSGIPSYTDLGDEWAVKRRLDLTHDELIALFKERPFNFAPGEKQLYNNSGYYLLGVIIEKVSGKSYAEYLRENIFEPLGMKSTCYGSEAVIIRNRAQGYRLVDGELQNDDFLSMNQPFAAGALVSTVTDLVIWMRALVDARVVSDESYELMTAPTVLKDGTSHNYGFGLSLDPLLDRPCVSHGGGINGFRSHLVYLPDEDLVIAVLANCETASPDRIAARIARRLAGG